MLKRFPQPNVNKEESPCKIRIRTTKHGKEISFEGKCRKEEIEIARDRLDVE